MPDMDLDHAARMVALHREMADLDEGDGNTLQVRLWHMLMDLRRFATVMGIDFDAVCADVAAEYPAIYDDEAA